MESVRLLAYQLLQGVGGCHINATAVHSRLDNLGRRVGHLETLAQERCVVDRGRPVAPYTHCVMCWDTIFTCILISKETGLE